jgi:hypothetical protein
MSGVKAKADDERRAGGRQQDIAAICAFPRERLLTTKVGNTMLSGAVSSPEGRAGALGRSHQRVLMKGGNQMKRLLSPRVQLFAIVLVLALSALVIGGEPWGP